jgi:hypothetical protein
MAKCQHSNNLWSEIPNRSWQVLLKSDVFTTVASRPTPETWKAQDANATNNVRTSPEKPSLTWEKVPLKIVIEIL